MLVGYARISTVHQSLDLQIEALKGAGCERIFTDTASGGQSNRAELKNALSYVRAGDTLVVWKLDRLARSMRHLIAIMDELGDKGAGFKSLTEGIDTQTPGGQLIFHIFASLAEFERALIRERTTAGLEAAKKRGAQLGRPEVMTTERMQKAEALMRSSNWSMSRIAREIGVATSSLYKAFPGGRRSM